MKMVSFALVVIVAEIFHAVQALNLTAVHPRPHEVVLDVHRRLNESITRRHLMGQRQGCSTGNPVDDCWRCDPNWQTNRQRLADCAVGFGADAHGGKNGRFYTVTSTADDPVSPAPGTLRYGVIQTEPLWIIFASSMNIQLKEELMINSYKTIDARGVEVHISNGPCLTIQGVSNVIIHGLYVHDCHPAGNAMVRDSPTHYGWRTICDGDGISIFQASHIWVDHCTLARCADGLIDAVEGSTALSFTNNHFSQHNEVMLLGASDSYLPDKNMQVTVAFNHFDVGLTQRMPRCRLGYFHVVNNDYSSWGIYAIGGSANPTILSMGNRYIAPDNIYSKQITYRNYASKSTWQNWNWRSIGDQYLNGAYFVPSGTAQNNLLAFSRVSVKTVDFVPILTSNAGVISCRSRGIC